MTCLNVSGNRATVGADAPIIGGIFSLEDNDGAGQDRSGLSLTPEFHFCPANPSITLYPIFGGDITIHDASVLPTSKEQCKNGGWRRFPGFKNQGDCTSFVATGGKTPPAGT